MKKPEILKFSITTVVNFALAIVSFDPARDIGEKWKFEDGINGPAESDGITAFKEVVAQAALLPKEEGYKLLFATGFTDGQTVITGDDRIKALAGKNLADPDLGWSLFNEEGQKTLRHLNDRYGVVWMEFLRRTLLRPDGSRRGFYLCRVGVGSWRWYYFWLVNDRNASGPALVLGQ